MAAVLVSTVSCSAGTSVPVRCRGSRSRGRGRALIEMPGRSASKRSFPTLFSSYSSESSSRSGRRGAGNVLASSVESAIEDIGLLYPTMSSPNTSNEFEVFQARRWRDTTREREAFANRGEITEAGMDRIVDALLQEEGQSAEDYQRRARFFNLIAEFFRQGKAYSAGQDEPRTSMQMLVDSILAEDGRSPTDYNARAQFFAKSAEIFPFKAEVGSA